MPKRKRKNSRKKDKKAKFEEEPVVRELLSPETKKSIFIIFLIALGFLTFMSFFDLAGGLGLYINKGFEAIFGWGTVIFPILLLVWAYMLLRPERYQIKPSNYLGLFILVLSYSGILQFIKDVKTETAFESAAGGGYLGFFIYSPLQKIMGPWAAVIILLALLFIALLITFNTSLKDISTKLNGLKSLKNRISRQPDEEDEDEEWEEESEEIEEDWQQPDLPEETEDSKDKEAPTAVKPAFIKKEIKPALAGIIKTKPKIPEGLSVTFSKGKRYNRAVPLDFLESRKGNPTSGDIKRNLETIRSSLENFNIPVEMGEVNVGPTVTQFTLKPEQGVKLSQIISLQNDLALALAAHPIRIEAPIPGKSLVGIEVPNQSIAIVKLKDLLTSKEFRQKKANLKICLGEDVSGKTWVGDLAMMPHLLIAGATGSGKSVCINNIIIGFLYQYSPEELRMIMVDPKKVELTNYNGIPHLMTPVITEVDKTINALRWAVKEMDERYKLLNSVGKRNIQSYNESVLMNKLPYIVIIIDELADLMVVASKDVEAAIVRLSQMARAVGIHLIVATQRPSVNVITGLIKANIPARIAFAVASQIDSRTILDASGAEKLLGKGDLLYTSAEVSKPRRIQGGYLSDDEIDKVIKFWQNQDEPDYVDEVIEGRSRGNIPGFSSNNDNGDELLDEARETVIKDGKASASLLQRRMRIGYARAARILDLLEDEGVIGPADGAKPREILVSDAEIMGIPVETTSRYETPVAETEEEEEFTEDLEKEETEEASLAKVSDDESELEYPGDEIDSEDDNETTDNGELEEEDEVEDTRLHYS